MNRNLDGRELSTEELEQIALDHGCITAEDLEARRAALHNKNMFASMLNFITSQARFDMFMRGELHLDTRSERRDEI